MATVLPFKALYYNPKMIPDLSEVITPPYDIIPPGEDQKYFRRHPYNFAHVLLPKNQNEDYAESAARLTQWRNLGILTQDSIPSFYLYQQSFEIGGVRHRRNTLLCAVQLSEFSERIIRPHEKIYDRFKEDRLKILRQTGCNLSPIFGLVKDPEGFLQSFYEKWIYQPPFLQGNGDDGISHTIWKKDAINAGQITRFFEDRPIYIVDGHHRYQSALAYAKELGALGNPNQPASQMLFAIATEPDPAVLILPTHRLVRELPSTEFKIADLADQYDLAPMRYDQLIQFVGEPQTIPSFAICFEGELLLCVPKHWENQALVVGNSLCRLGVVWSDNYLMKDFFKIDDSNRGQRVSYEKNLEPLWEKRTSEALIVFLPPLSVKQMTAVADEEKFLPQKSTYFYPKLASGLILRELTNGALSKTT